MTSATTTKKTMETPALCFSCNEGGECLFDRIWPGLEVWLSSIDKTTPNNLKRKEAYREAILFEHGFLGKNNREPVPLCTMEKIRKAFPDVNGVYMGHKEA